MASLGWPSVNGNIVRLRLGIPSTSLGKWLPLSGCPGARGFPCPGIPRFSASEMFPCVSDHELAVIVCVTLKKSHGVSGPLSFSN